MRRTRMDFVQLGVHEPFQGGSVASPPKQSPSPLGHNDSMRRPRKVPPPKPLSRARERARASWIFSSVLLAVLVAVVWFAPERLAGFKQQLVAIFAALLAGFMAYFLTGDLGIERSWLRASGGLGAFALLLFLWPKLAPASGPDVYRLRVTVLAPEGHPREDAELRSSVGGEQKKVQGGWEVDIPASALPADRKVTLYADRLPSNLHGSREVILDKDFQPAVTVELKEDSSVKVFGKVKDGEGRPVEGARVWVKDYPSESVTTSQRGEFTLNAHAPLDQMVLLHVKKLEIEPPPQGQPAGRPATLILDRQ